MKIRQENEKLRASLDKLVVVVVVIIVGSSQQQYSTNNNIMTNITYYIYYIYMQMYPTHTHTLVLYTHVSLHSTTTTRNHNKPASPSQFTQLSNLCNNVISLSIESIWILFEVECKASWVQIGAKLGSYCTFPGLRAHTSLFHWNCKDS